jgi:hypothetical protein
MDFRACGLQIPLLHFQIAVFIYCRREPVVGSLLTVEIQYNHSFILFELYAM